MNGLLTEDGQHYQHTEITIGRALVIDVGGFTIDWVAVNPVTIDSLIKQKEKSRNLKRAGYGVSEENTTEVYRSDSAEDTRQFM